MQTLQDDPIKNTPANPRGYAIHTLHPMLVSNVAEQSAASYQTDPHFGRFDYDGFYDPAGQLFEAYGFYDVGNNNIVAAVLRVTLLSGQVQVRTFRLGGIENIADPNYVKIDGVRAVRRGKRIAMFLTGHKIAEGPDNTVRRMGQVWEIQTTPDDLWLVFAPSDHVWPDYGQGVLLSWAQKLYGANLFTGDATGFHPAAKIDNAHFAAVAGRLAEYLGG